MNNDLSQSEIRKLKALAQRLDPVVWVGKSGVSDAFLKSLNEALDCHELVKVKFSSFKEAKKELAPVLAAKTSSSLIQRVGNVLVLYRRQPEPARRVIPL